MQYLSGGKEMSKRFEGANSYTGTRADDYDEIRKKKKEWKVSEDIVFNLLKDITANQNELTVLDIPVGTGRFFNIYKKFSLKVIGIDISNDMLKMAQKKSSDVDLRKGDILNLPLDIKPNIVICVGFLHLITKEDIKKVIQSIMKTETEYVIISALIETSKKEITEKAVIKTTSSINRIRKLTKDAYQCLLREGVKNTLLKIKQFERMSHPNEDLIINEFNKNKFVVKNKIDFGKTLGSTDYIFLSSKEKN